VVVGETGPFPRLSGKVAEIRIHRILDLEFINLHIWVGALLVLDSLESELHLQEGLH